MEPVKQNTAFRCGFRLRSAADGTALTGVLYTSVTATARKSDGTFATITVGASDWSESTTGAFLGSGEYELLVPSSVTDTVGGLKIAISTPASAEVAVAWATVRANTEAEVKTVADAIKAKTDNLPADPASQATTASEITSATSPLATASALAADTTAIEAAITAATSPLATSSALSTLQTSATAIKAKTDNLPTDPADESLLEAAITAATNTLAADIAGATVDLTPVLNVLGAPIHGSIALDIANVSGGGSGHTLIAGRTLVIYSVLDEDRRVPALVEAIGPNNILALFVFDPVVGNYHLRKVPFSTGHEENTWDWNDTV